MHSPQTSSARTQPSVQKSALRTRRCLKSRRTVRRFYLSHTLSIYIRVCNDSYRGPVASARTQPSVPKTALRTRRCPKSRRTVRRFSLSNSVYLSVHPSIRLSISDTERAHAGERAEIGTADSAVSEVQTDGTSLLSLTLSIYLSIRLSVYLYPTPSGRTRGSVPKLALRTRRSPKFSCTSLLPL